ncbi:unnamed protein product [Phytophthora lilii]|uniref:Unnamed protein product n=1 Tax=Phytophthora lilii TaxID=2077276 RepID=A0A9W6TDF7_9STRA|nr:unnamed protein product [Phytophthora lilii]
MKDSSTNTAYPMCGCCSMDSSTKRSRKVWRRSIAGNVTASVSKVARTRSCVQLPIALLEKKDLWLMGNLVFNFATEDMEERFYCSGVREFTLATSEDIRRAIDSCVDDVSSLLSDKFSVLSGKSQVDRLRLSDQMRCFISTTGRAGHGSFAGSVFEVYLHRIACDNNLRLYVSEYDSPERRKPNEPRHLQVKQVHLKIGGAICSGMPSDYGSHLEKWRDEEQSTYWFPACHDFPNIDSIVKLEAESGKMSNVAYLQMTIAAEHEIDGK